MNWDAVGALAELIGAVAVIATLIYLSIQIRQNTRANEIESSQGNLDQGVSWMNNLIQDPSLAELYLAGLQDKLDTEEQRLRFHLLMQGLFTQWGVMYKSGTNLVDEDVLAVLSSPGGRRYWDRAKKRGTHSGSLIGEKYEDVIDKIALRLDDNA